MSILKIKKLRPDAVIPVYKHNKDSGLDLCSVEQKIIKSGQVGVISTGIAIELEEGCEAQIRPRSGLASQKRLTVVNAPGTVDFEYRGEIKVALINLGDFSYEIQPGERIAQMCICPIDYATVELVEDLSDTVRGDGGFGSTGK